MREIPAYSGTFQNPHPNPLLNHAEQYTTGVFETLGWERVPKTLFIISHTRLGEETNGFLTQEKKFTFPIMLG